MDTDKRPDLDSRVQFRLIREADEINGCAFDMLHPDFVSFDLVPVCVHLRSSAVK
jgi:hypothetical protein